jgi:hypothetical protein
MAREIATFIWCDPCNLDEVREQGVEHVVTYGSWKPRRIALCERHEKELLNPMLEVLKEAEVDPGGQVGRPRAAESTVNTINCAICSKSLKNRGSLGSHVRSSHDMMLSAYWETYPDADGNPRNDAPQGDDALPLEEATPTSDLVKESCPDCGKEYEGSASRINQIIGVHRAKTHGVKGKKTKK